jgi:aminotransferase
MVDAVNTLHSDTRHHRKKTRSKRDRHSPLEHHSPNQGLRKMNSGLSRTNGLIRLEGNTLRLFTKITKQFETFINQRRYSVDYGDVGHYISTKGIPGISSGAIDFNSIPLEPIAGYTRQAREHGATVLAQGNPGDTVQEGLANSLRNISDTVLQNYPKGQTGSSEVNREYIKYLETTYQIDSLDLSENNIQPVLGAKSGLTMAVEAFSNRKDGRKTLVVAGPGYPPFAQAAIAKGLQVFVLNTSQENDHALDLSKLPQNVLDDTFMVVLNKPGNPTSAAPSRNEYDHFAKFLREHPQIIGFSDEAYNHLTDEEPLSMLQSVQPEDTNFIIFKSLSKEASAAGLRYGFALGPKSLIEQLRLQHQSANGGIPEVLNSVALEAIPHIEETSKRARTLYKKNLDTLVSNFEQMGWRDIRPSRAGMYLWLQVPKNLQNKLFDGKPASEVFYKILLKAGVGVIPGHVFEGKESANYIRISLGSSEKNIQEAIRKLTSSDISFDMQIPSEYESNVVSIETQKRPNIFMRLLGFS